MKLFAKALLLFLIAISSLFAENVKVARVIDGDTFVGSNGITYRLVGIDAPESKHPTKPVEYFGPEASEALQYLIGGKYVSVVFDSKSQKKDKYGRSLVIVYDGETMINALMVITGYAKVESRFPISEGLNSFLQQSQAIAQQDSKGIWGKTKIPQTNNNDICTVLYGAKIIANDGTYLGKLVNSHDPESIFNKYGLYGSDYGINSIWNTYSIYGSDYSLYSPFNSYSTTPPAIVANGDIIGYLSINSYVQGAVTPQAILKACNW
jgi:endonuclease YncB( thermonuclease family)